MTKKLVLFNWRDPRHKRAGGAETYTRKMLNILASRGYECTWYSSQPGGLPERERLDGFTIIRQGSELTCRVFAASWLMRHRNSVDVVVDEVNTLPFLSPLIARDKTVLLIHQLAREVWYYETPRFVSSVGHFIEPLLLRFYKSTPVITVSNSSAESLREYGLRGANAVVENALEGPSDRRTVPEVGLVGYVGRVTPSKRIDHIIRAVARLVPVVPNLRFVALGDGHPDEFQRLEGIAADLNVRDHVSLMGRVSDEVRDEWMSRFDVLAMASVREGWGLVVSEAARYGVPAVAYDVPGLRDSIVDARTGVLTHPSPEALADGIASVVQDRPRRDALGAAAAQNLSAFSLANFARKLESVFT